MKTSKLCPTLQSAKISLIKAINSELRNGKPTKDAIYSILPVLCHSVGIQYATKENFVSGQYGIKVELISNNQKLTLKF